MKIAWINRTQYRSVCENLAAGAHKFGHSARGLRAHKDYSKYDVVISFGDTPVIIAKHQTWLHLDGAYLNRPDYIRITKNAFQPHEYIMDHARPDDRWKQLGTAIQPWRRKGKYILICKVSDRNEYFLNFNMQDGLNAVIEQAKKCNIPVKIREKAAKFSRPFEKDLSKAFALVTWASTTSVQALLAGVPIFLLHNSACNSLAGNIFQIDKPVHPDREQWAYNLAYQQWNREEIRDGTAWKHFMENDNGES